jgi:GDP-L-fucose synthase
MTPSDFWKDRTVLVTGASGFVGSNLTPMIAACGCNLITPSHAEYDLLDQVAVRRMFADHKPDVVFHLAGLVGGIMANARRPADYSYRNLLMNTLVMHEAWAAGAKKFITLIGGCSYPATAPNPIAETQLWKGYPQAESAPYSVAKAMNVVMGEAYRRQHGFDNIVLVPGNLYGPHDNFDLQTSHVIPGMIHRFLLATREKQTKVTVWGTGRPIRDFIYVTDACEAIVVAAEKYESSEIINISAGVQITIRELAETIAELVGFEGEIEWDTSKPDGQIYKGFDVTRMHERLGYDARTTLREGLSKTIDWLIANYATARLNVPM